MSSHQKKFLNLTEMQNFLGSISDKFDIAKSAALPTYSFATKDGVNHFGRHFQDYLLKLKEFADVPVSVEGSFVQGYITLNFEVDPKELLEKSLNKQTPSSTRKTKAK